MDRNVYTFSTFDLVWAEGEGDAFRVLGRARLNGRGLSLTDGEGEPREPRSRPALLQQMLEGAQALVARLERMLQRAEQPTADLPFEEPAESPAGKTEEEALPAF